jgi:glycosyltransferase involved in cell wall biosynthesis
MNPLISVVIPTYNHAHFLRFALQSVIEQTYQNWEIIIIDNHSSDNTDEVLKQFDFYNLRIFKINNNGIIGVSRNVGIKAAKGDWIAFLDSDDIWYKEKLKKSVDAILDNPNINVICTDIVLIFIGHF